MGHDYLEGMMASYEKNQRRKETTNKKRLEAGIKFMRSFGEQTYTEELDDGEHHPLMNKGIWLAMAGPEHPPLTRGDKAWYIGIMLWGFGGPLTLITLMFLSTNPDIEVTQENMAKMDENKQVMIKKHAHAFEIDENTKDTTSYVIEKKKLRSIHQLKTN